MTPRIALALLSITAFISACSDEGNNVTARSKAPAVASASLNEGPHYETSLIQVTPIGGAENDSLEYSYRWVVDGVEVKGETGPTLTGLSFSKGATVQAEVTPHVGSRTGASLWSNVATILNSPPSITRADLNSTVADETHPLTVTAVGLADADGDKPTVTYQWYVNGLAIAGASEDSQTGASFAKGDSVYVRLTPDDGDKSGNNLGVTVDSATAVIGNSVPAIDTVLVGASPSQTTDTVALVSATTWADADGDGQDGVYQWFIDVGTVGTWAAIAGQTGPSLTGANFSKGDSIRLRVWPFDGEAAGAPVDSNAVLIVNTTPVMAGISLSAGPYVEANAITATPLATDADGDGVTYTYDWRVNSSSSGITANNITGANFNKGDSVFVRVMPSDGAAGSPMDSATVVIGNTAPTLALATIASIGDPAYGTAATFYVDAWVGLADMDATDPLSLHYQWKVNGTPVLGQTARTLTALVAAKGENVSVDVIAFDGTVEGTLVTAGPALVVNTPPTLGSVGFGTGPFYVGDTLTASDFGYLDADGDLAGASSYRWFVNGVFVAGTAGLNTGFAQGDTVTVSAAPFDGADFGATVIASTMTIQNHKPVMDTVTISAAPLPATEMSTLTYVATSHDDDAGDTVTELRMWMVNGSPTGVTGTTLTGASFGRTDVITLRITPYDGIDNGTPMTSNAVAIENTAPSQAGLTLFPSLYLPGNDLFVSVTMASTDADADPVGYTYAWTKNGAAQGFTAGTTVIDSALLAIRDTWKVVVTPTDGFANGLTTWAQKTIPAGVFSDTGSLGTARYFHTSTLLPNGKVLTAGGSNGSAMASAELYYPAAGTFAATGALGAARYWHTSTLLPNGKVLIAGGYNGSATGSAELYDPTMEAFTSTTGSLGTPRRLHTATLLPNGKVLITGGIGDAGTLSSAELYDPATDTFVTTGSLSGIRYAHTATLLPNGKVLIAGGRTVDMNLGLFTAELYDPASGAFSATGRLLGSGRERHTATLLPNGKVLIAGGNYGFTPLATAELYDPAVGGFTATGPLGSTHYSHTATLLPNGKVLIAGGGNFVVYLAGAELYDPAAGTFAVTRPLARAREAHTSTLLPNGKVLIAGGGSPSGPLVNAELYDPQDASPGLFAATGSLVTARTYHTATRLPNGKVLIAGGYNGGLQAQAELYDPVTATFTATGSLGKARFLHTATLLPNGKVLITGGEGATGSLVDAELYDPAAGTFAATTAPLATARRDHTATLLPNGNVLIAGGDNGGGYLASAELYDPATGTFAVTTGPLGTARFFHTSTLLPDGTVLLAGGAGMAGYLDGAELYYPAAATFAATAGTLGMGRYSHSATLLPNGKVLITGGDSGAGGIDGAELYDPATRSFAATTAPLGTARKFHTSTLLPNGKVLIAGGEGAAGFLASGELYDPAANTFAATTGTLGTARRDHTATLLPNGKVLFVGGPGANGLLAELYQ